MSNAVAMNDAAVRTALLGAGSPLLTDMLSRAAAVQAAARRRVKKRTGRLEDAITRRVVRTKDGFEVEVGVWTVSYAAVQEFDAKRGRSYLRASLSAAGTSARTPITPPELVPIPRGMTRVRRNRRISRYTPTERRARAIARAARAPRGRG